MIAITVHLNTFLKAAFYGSHRFHYNRSRAYLSWERSPNSCPNSLGQEVGQIRYTRLHKAAAKLQKSQLLGCTPVAKEAIAKLFARASWGNSTNPVRLAQPLCWPSTPCSAPAALPSLATIKAPPKTIGSAPVPRAARTSPKRYAESCLGERHLALIQTEVQAISQVGNLPIMDHFILPIRIVNIRQC